MQILDIPIVLTTIPSFHLKFLQVHRPFNESAEFSSHLKTIEIPFYIRDDFLYFNASKANEIGVDDKYHVIITANGTEPGRVGMVLTTVSVERGGHLVLCVYLWREYLVYCVSICGESTWYCVSICGESTWYCVSICGERWTLSPVSV